MINKFINLFLVLGILLFPSNGFAASRFTFLDVVSTNIVGASFDLENTIAKSFHIILSAGTATIAIETSIDGGINFINLMVPATATSIVYSNVAMSHARAIVTNCIACEVTVKCFAERNL